jgi:ornithine cyclodeaminase
VKLLVLAAPDVHQLLGYRECAEVMRNALTGLAGGRGYQPLRTVSRPVGAPGLMGLMPAYLDSAATGTAGAASAYGLKVIWVSPGNAAIGIDTHLGLMLLADGQTGEPLAVLNASAITDIRTAAVSVVATQALARAGAADLAVIGTGVQARAHILALSQARPLRRIRVAGRDQARAAAFAADLRGKVDTDITAAASAADAVAGADIIVTATSSAQPVLRREWISAGAHVNAVGAFQPAARELDGATVAAAALFADSRESLAAESGDYLLALAEGLVGPGHLRAELGEVLAGTAPGRVGDDEITVFESLGLAIEDLAAARHAVRRAQETGAGQWVDF